MGGVKGEKKIADIMVKEEGRVKERHKEKEKNTKSKTEKYSISIFLSPFHGVCIFSSLFVRIPSCQYVS